LRVWGIEHGLPEINRYIFETDEQHLLNLSMAFGTGDLNPHCFPQPGFYLYIMFFFFGIFYILGMLTGSFANPVEFGVLYFNDPTMFYLIGRGLNVIFGVFTIYLLYKLGEKLFNKQIGLIAALLLVVTPVHVFYSHTVKTDTLAALLSLLCIYFSFDILRDGKIKSIVLASLCAGLTVGTRYPQGLIILVVIAAFLFRSKREVFTLKGVKILSLISLVFIGGFFIVSPYNFLDWKNFVSQEQYAKMTLTAAGAKYDWIIQHFLDSAHRNQIGAGFTLLAIAALLWSFFKRTKPDILLNIGWIPVFLFFSLPKWYLAPPQYMLNIFPVWMLLIARFMWDVFMGLKLKQPARIAVILCCIVFPALTVIKNNLALGLGLTTQQAKRWVEANIPQRSVVLMNFAENPQLTLTPDAYNRFRYMVDNSVEREKLAGVRWDFIPGEMNNEKSELKRIKQRSLTRGTQYDVYFYEKISKDHHGNFQELLDVHRIEYVVASLKLRKYLLGSDFPRLRLLKDFHADNWIPVFTYNIAIYKVEDNG